MSDPKFNVQNAVFHSGEKELNNAIELLRKHGEIDAANALKKSILNLGNMPNDEYRYYCNQARVTLTIDNLEKRWKQANKMSISYMEEFAKRGLVYAPLINVEPDSFK